MKRTRTWNELSPEEQSEKDAIADQIIEEILRETPEEQAEHSRRYYESFFTLPDKEFWACHNSGRDWEEQMAACVKYDKITDVDLDG